MLSVFDFDYDEYVDDMWKPMYVSTHIDIFNIYIEISVNVIKQLFENKETYILIYIFNV